jgi:hypothetical protein
VARSYRECAIGLTQLVAYRSLAGSRGVMKNSSCLIAKGLRMDLRGGGEHTASGRTSLEDPSTSGFAVTRDLGVHSRIE